VDGQRYVPTLVPKGRGLYPLEEAGWEAGTMWTGFLGEQQIPSPLDGSNPVPSRA
jgi:hypothetical protein